MKSNLQLGFLVGIGLMCGTTMAQQEGPVATQALVDVDAKSSPPANAAALTVSVDGKKEPVTGWIPVAPANAQVALLIDSGLRESVGREIDTLHAFIRGLPAGVEVLVGSMQSGNVVTEGPFTADHEAASKLLHLPAGSPGVGAIPYGCLSDFTKRWAQSAGPHKARFVLMITNGVDPYSGSTGATTEDSPYVSAAVKEAQRAGVAVYAIYYADGGNGGSGQNYLARVTQETGGRSLYEGMGTPVSMAPFLAEFQRAVAETYVATFAAPAGKDLVHVKISAPKAKLRSSENVRPGNQE
jgi:hypothetical protein